jgi:hypothetical protein
LRAPFLVYWMNSRAPQTLPPWGSFLWGEFCKPKETKAGFRSERGAMLRAPVHGGAFIPLSFPTNFSTSLQSF